MIIVSEQQAEQVGQFITGGALGTDFKVFSYDKRPERLTAFGVEIIDGNRFVLVDPRRAVSRHNLEK